MAFNQVDETGDGVRRAVFELADVDDGFQNRTVGPEVGAAQVADFQKFDVFAHGVVMDWCGRIIA